ncbi:alpha/beta fold hydrolase [Bacillus sp. DJP31]|uniref:alpha/beta fold hydrolase n=1 Tax=Bacillus sp. DJP31 TaxID=3409789 RepID=UPI003BB5F8C4
MSKISNKTTKSGSNYFIIENKGKETILMLHPAFTDHKIFEFQTEYFKEKYQLILLDLPGHGERQVKGSKSTIGDMPEVLNQILFENNIASCHLIGVSLGSLVAQAFAARYPNQVMSVIIVGGYSIHKANEDILKSQKREGLKWILYILFSMKSFRRYVTSVSSHTDLCRELFASGTKHFKRRSFAAMAGINTFFINKDTPISYPLLIIVGEHDQKLIQESATKLHALEKHSQYVLLQGAGHCANVDVPDKFNGIAEKFLSEIRLLSSANHNG